MRIQRPAQARHQFGQWVTEIPVFTLAKAVALHYHPAAKGALLRVAVHLRQGGALGSIQQLGQHGIA